MSRNTGSARGGTSLTVSQWTLRGVVPALGRTPALRGYPGGIDAAGPGWPDLATGGDHAESGGNPAQVEVPWAAAGPERRRRLRGRRGRMRRSGTGGSIAGPGGRSVWQQSLSAWREAGLDWQRPAGWASADADLQRTEPIPIVPAAAMPVAAPRPEPGRGKHGAGPEGPDTGRAEPDTGRAELDTGRAEPDAAPGGPDGGPAGPDAGRDEPDAGRAEPDTGRAEPDTGRAEPDTGRAEPDTGRATNEPGAGGQEAGHQPGQPPRRAEQPGQARQHPGRGQPHPRRSGRTVLLGAVACVVLLAVAVAGILVTGPLKAGPGGPPGPVVAYPPARLADAQFTGPGGSAGPEASATINGVAAADHTVVAVGSRPTLPFARPLILTSPDGGRTWRPAVLHAPGGATAGAVPLIVACGDGHWLAVGRDAAWTSPDGRSWRLGPGIAPLAGGDRVQALAQTGGGFVAVGENMHRQGAGVVRTPVLWMSGDGLNWQRQGAGQLGLPAGKGRVVGLRLVAAHGSVLMIAGQVARTVVRQRGKRKVSVLAESTRVWLSQDDGAHWLRADPPVSHGAAAGLDGLAATSFGIVAVRPGRSPAGARDAVAYIWAHGPAWRFASVLTARRGAALDVTAVAGSDQGAVAAGSAGRNRVAFVSRRGWSWHQTAGLGTSPATAVTGVTVGPGGRVVAAGVTRPGPFLLLAGKRRLPVGQAALAGAAAAGLSVNGLGVGPGGQVAVGQASGAPAIWLRPPGGSWAQVAAKTPRSWHGTGPGLTSVVHGAAGWLAAGSEGRQAAQLGAAGTLASAAALGAQQPVLLTSPDGQAWRPAAGARSPAAPDLSLTAAAAGPSGYVVAGVRDDHGQPAAALWWSASLTTWIPQELWTGTAPEGAASALLAVASGRTGFAAVGAAGMHPAVWLSGNGQGWRLLELPLPARASSAVLQRVAIQGRRIAALGTLARPSGPVPFAAVSANGGSTWRETVLPAPGGLAGVTALVTAGGGFLATGTVSAGGTQDVIVWWSPDGLAWQAVRPAGKWLSGPGAQQITGLSVSGNVLTGVGYAATGTGQHPVLWQARIR